MAAFSMVNLRKLKTTPVAVVVMWYSGHGHHYRYDHPSHFEQASRSNWFGHLGSAGWHRFLRDRWPVLLDCGSQVRDSGSGVRHPYLQHCAVIHMGNRSSVGVHRMDICVGRVSGQLVCHHSGCCQVEGRISRTLRPDHQKAVLRLQMLHMLPFGQTREGPECNAFFAAGVQRKHWREFGAEPVQHCPLQCRPPQRWQVKTWRWLRIQTTAYFWQNFTPISGPF